MICYIVTFDIASPLTRAAFKDRLKTYGSYCPIHEYCWAILTDRSAVQIRDALQPHLGPDGRLLVIRSGVESAWSNSYGSANNDWLRKNL